MNQDMKFTTAGEMVEKIYCYEEWDYIGNDRVVEITESEILDIYWKVWSKEMKDHNLDHEISEEKCIKDWVELNYAWEKK